MADIKGSELYSRVILVRDDDLMHKVWKKTPWIIDAYTGNISNTGRYREIMEWCRNNFGKEAQPIHGGIGDWRSGNATVHGYTWMGFKTKKMMNLFCKRWSKNRPEGG